MSAAVHPAAAHHLPVFITAPGETDVMMNVTLVILIATLVGIGLLYFRLHALPEHIAHKTSKIQLQVVGVLGLLALFTHNHLYWIAALLLALIPIPDFSSPLSGMAASLARMADNKQSLPGSEPATRPKRPAPAAKKPTTRNETKEADRA